MNFYQWDVIYPVYFLVYEVVSEVLLVHCTIYIAQNHDVMQAKRLTPIILGGWQTGSIIGGVLLASVAGKIGVHNMLLLWVLLLLIAVMMVYRHHQKVGVSSYYRPGRKGRHTLNHVYEQFHQCISLAKHSRLLQAMSFALFFMVVTFYILCYSVNRVYASTFASEDDLAVFYGMLTVVTGVLALLAQIFLTNRIIRRFGVRAVNLVFPVVTILALSGLLFSFAFVAALFGSLVKDSLMPALRNPVRALLFNAIPTHMQGKAHSFSIGVVLPLALSFAGITLGVVQSIDSPQYFLTAGIITALAYLVFNVHTNRSYLNAIVAGLREKLFIPDDDLARSVRGEEENAFEVLMRACRHDDEEIRFMSARSMLELFPHRATPFVIDVLSDLAPPLRDRLIRLLLPLEPEELKEKLWQEIDNGDAHLRATIMYSLFRLRDDRARGLVRDALYDENPRIKSIGIYGVMHYPLPDLSSEAFSQWKAMLTSQDLAKTLASLDLLFQWPSADHLDSLSQLLHSADQRIQKSALKALLVWPDNNIPDLGSTLQQYLLSDDPAMREIATKCLVKLGEQKKSTLARQSLEDIHPDVRLAAANILFAKEADISDIVDWLVEYKGSPRSQEAILKHLLARNPPRHIKETLAHHYADDAVAFFDAHKQISEIGSTVSMKTPAITMLDYALEERGREMIDIALLAASEIEDPYTIGAIRAGIKSKEKRHWANSCEAIRYIQDKKLARSLTIVLEQLGSEVGLHPKSKQTEIAGLKPVLNWLASRNDPWLQLCVQMVK